MGEEGNGSGREKLTTLGCSRFFVRGSSEARQQVADQLCPGRKANKCCREWEQAWPGGS